MAVEWIPALLEAAYANRKHVVTGWDKLLNKIWGPKSNIAFVGPGGIGKSVLLDHIVGKANQAKYKLPPKSNSEEFGRTRRGGRRLAFTVAPGQGGPQQDSYDNIFGTGSQINGVVFVVGNGFATLRDEKSYDAETKRYPSLDEWRKVQIAEEISVLREVCSHIRKLKRTSRAVQWILVAVTKADLFTNEIETIKDYYEDENGPFSIHVSNLQRHVGKDNLEWGVVPVCSRLEEFVWVDRSVASGVSVGERDAYISQFIDAVKEYCR